MEDLSNRRRRFYLRVGFLSLCLLPTTVMLAWALAGSTPRQQARELAAWQARLSQWLGAQVELKSIRRYDSVIVLSEVAVFDEETRLPLAQAQEVTIYPGAELTQVVVSHPRLFMPQLDLLWQLAGAVQSKSFATPIVLDANQCTLAGPDARTLETVRVQMKQSPRAARWDVHFRVAGSDATNKSTFSLHRDRQAGRAKVSWALSTQNARLPLSIAWSVCPSLRQLGEACEFSGRIRSIQQSPERRMTEIAGSISAIRLDQLSAPFSFRLSGLGRLFLSQAELVQTTGRATMLAAASGSFESSAGTIGRRILQSARDAFSLTMDSRFERQSLFGYRDLVLRFALGDGKLAVRGKKASGRGMDAWPILFDRKSGLAMLGGSTSELIPAIAISRFLAIPSEHKVSATREVYDFLRHLPTPRRRVPKSHLPRTSIRVQ